MPDPHASLGAEIERQERRGRLEDLSFAVNLAVLYESALTILRKPLDTSRPGFSIPRDAPTSERTRLLMYSRHGQVHPGRRGPCRKAARADGAPTGRNGDIRGAAFPTGLTLVQLASGRAGARGEGIRFSEPRARA